MPLKECKNKNGESGWQWGSGPCVVGKDAKLKVIKMAIKIEWPEKFKEIMKKEHNAKAKLDSLLCYAIISNEFTKDEIKNIWDLDEQTYLKSLIVATLYGNADFNNDEPLQEDDDLGLCDVCEAKITSIKDNVVTCENGCSYKKTN